MKSFTSILAIAVSFFWALDSIAQNNSDGYNAWYKVPGTRYLQCTDYPSVGAPKDPNFKPDKHRWPAYGGIKQNKKGPYSDNGKCELPDAGITVGGGQYGWASAGLVQTVSDGQVEESKALRKMLSSAQKQILMELEAQNSNWTYSMQSNGIRITPIDFDIRCIYDHVNFVTDDGKSYYHNYYRYLGIYPEDKHYIPTFQLRDYLTPDELRAKLASWGCLRDL